VQQVCVRARQNTTGGEERIGETMARVQNIPKYVVAVAGLRRGQMLVGHGTVLQRLGRASRSVVVPNARWQVIWCVV